MPTQGYTRKGEADRNSLGSSVRMKPRHVLAQTTHSKENEIMIYCNQPMGRQRKYGDENIKTVLMSLNTDITDIEPADLGGPCDNFFLGATQVSHGYYPPTRSMLQQIHLQIQKENSGSCFQENISTLLTPTSKPINLGGKTLDHHPSALEGRDTQKRNLGLPLSRGAKWAISEALKFRSAKALVIAPSPRRKRSSCKKCPAMEVGKIHRTN